MGLLQAIRASLSPSTGAASKPKVIYPRRHPYSPAAIALRTFASKIVIGAGVSGLACASELVKAGHSVLVLEARDRIGGRTHTFVDGQADAPFDLGASFIHGLAGNPLAKLAKENNLKLFRPDSSGLPESAVPLVWSREGPPLPKELSERLSFNSMRTAFSTSVEHAQERTDGYPSDTEALADWVLDEHRSTLYEGLKDDDEKSFARQMIGSWDGWTGADFKDVSLKYWQSDITYSGGDATIVDGYRGIYEGLAKILREHNGAGIKINQEVVSIVYDEDEEIVTVETKNPHSEAEGVAQTSTSTFTGEYVVCTLPLGVLKQRPPKFSPPLSLRRREAVERLQMGLLNKIIVTYDRCFWPKDQPFLSFLSSPASVAFLPNLKSRALFAQNYKLITGTNTLVFYLGSDTGAAMEKLSNEEIKDGIHTILKHHFGTEEGFPKDGQGSSSIVVTRWLSDPYSCGSYSYIRPAKEAETPVPTPYDFAEFARPAWGERLYFAGEATNADHYATVHGALITGRSQAQAVLDAIEARSQAA